MPMMCDDLEIRLRAAMPGMQRCFSMISRMHFSVSGETFPFTGLITLDTVLRLTSASGAFSLIVTHSLNLES